MQKLVKFLSALALLINGFVFALQAQKSDATLLLTKDPTNLLVLKNKGVKLSLLYKMGPVFYSNGSSVGPGDYVAKLVSSKKVGNREVYEFSADVMGNQEKYTVEAEMNSASEVTFYVSGSKKITEFRMGNINGGDREFKQFFTGEREVESFPNNDDMCPVIYEPQLGLYLYCDWDMDYANSAGYTHRLSPKRNFIAKNPPIGSDFLYPVLSDGSRNLLKEKFTIRFSPNLWEVYAVKNKPSEYRQDLSSLVYFDSWAEKFQTSINALTWINQATKGRIRFYSIFQTWANWKSWDATNPDAFRTPDYARPGPMYGSSTEFNALLKQAGSMGMFGLRCNYMHIGPDSWSIKEGFVKPAINADGEKAWFTDFTTTKNLVVKQENDIKTAFHTQTAFHDQWASGGSGWPVINYDATVEGAGKLSATRKMIKDMCKITKELYKGPLSSETLNGEFLMGEYVDTGDYGIFEAANRFDISPEYKLRNLHDKSVFYGMGLGYRFYVGPSVKDWANPSGKGYEYYYDNDLKLDKYRSCELLWGNGAYLFFTERMRKVHLLEEALTIGLAQKYYLLEAIEAVLYGKSGSWKRYDQIIEESGGRDELFEWQKQFHVTFKNGTHIWVNRSATPMVVSCFNKNIKLPEDGWIVYNADGSMIAYTALMKSPVVAGHEDRIVFCEDKNAGIKYINPRSLSGYGGVNAPTVWIDGALTFTLMDPNSTF